MIASIVSPIELALHQLASFVGKNDSGHITTSQIRSCMVLTRSMATNNNQGEELRTTNLERQV